MERWSDGVMETGKQVQGSKVQSSKVERRHQKKLNREIREKGRNKNEEELSVVLSSTPLLQYSSTPILSAFKQGDF